MKQNYALLAMAMLCTFTTSALADDVTPQATKWNFTTVPSVDETNLTADSNWKTDSKKRYCFTPAMTAEAAKANGTELSMTAGLLFTIPANTDGNLRVGGSTASLWLGDACTMTIPACKAGQFIDVEYMTSKNTATRQITSTNLASQLESTTGKTHQRCQRKITADGDVTLTIPGGIYFYSLVVGDSLAVYEQNETSGSEPSPENPDNPTDTTHNFDIAQDFTLLRNNIFGNGPKIYVSPEGNDENEGTKESPLQSIQAAVDKAVDPGTTIILAPGEYRPVDRINIDQRNGTHDNYNAMVCLDGRATINCNHPTHGHSDNPYQGIRLTSSYWYFYHVDITNASDNGMLIERNKPTGGSASDIVNLTDQAHDNIIECCNFYKNGDTGLQMKNLASYNYIINCDSYLNCDEGQGDADGFAPKISVGTGNYFFGCRAYLNSDDGWDVFYKKTSGFGDNQTIIMQNCVTYKNGFLDENTIAKSGNGNGFKCGSDQGAMNVYLNRCVSVCNKAKGFDQNHNSGDIILNNCTGMTLKEIGDKAYSYRIYEDIAEGHKVEVTNCIAINDNDATDKRDSKGVAKPAEHGKQGQYGRFQIDDTLACLTITSSEFQKAQPAFFFDTDKHAQLMAERDEKGNLQEITFAHINSESAETKDYDKNTISAKSLLVDKGSKVETTTYQGLAVPAITYNGIAPDLGAYETEASTSGITTLSAAHAKAGRVTLNQTMSGIVLVTIEGASLSDTHTLTLSTLNGQQLAKYDMKGSTTAITLPHVTGTVIMSVKGSGVHESMKFITK